MEKLKETLAVRKVISVVFLSLAIFCFSGTAYALHYDLGNETTLDCDVQLKYSAAIRAKDQESSFLRDPNRDDGDRNFDQWEMTNNKFSMIVDIDLRRNNLGFFLRPRAYYDFVYENANSNDSPATINKFGRHNHFADRTEDLFGQKAEILDAFLYGKWDLGGHSLSLRVGQQAINWGQSWFVGVNSISSAMSPFDTTQFHIPGTEFKEVLLPVEQAYCQFELMKDVSLAVYYQWEWQPNRFDESGSFFGTADFLFKAGDYLIIPGGAFPKGGLDKPKDSGQFGVRLNYRAPWFLDSEFGFFYINYHDKGPQVNIPELVGVIPSVVLRYAENIKLYGFSLGTQIGDVAVGFETSYRRNFPVSVNGTGGPIYRRADVWQVQANAIYAFPPALFYDQVAVLGEIGYNRVDRLDGWKLATADRWAWGGTAVIAFDFLNLVPGTNLNLNVPISYSFNPEGVSPVAGSFSEGGDSYAVGFNFTYNQVYKFDLGYTGFLGNAGNNQYIDRDYISLNLTYTF